MLPFETIRNNNNFLLYKKIKDTWIPTAPIFTLPSSPIAQIYMELNGISTQNERVYTKHTPGSYHAPRCVSSVSRRLTARRVVIAAATLITASPKLILMKHIRIWSGQQAIVNDFYGLIRVVRGQTLQPKLCT